MIRPDGGQNVKRTLKVLWLTPDKPNKISVGRRRIAEQLQEAGIDVTLRGTTPRTLLTSLRERGKYDAVIGTTRSGAMCGALLKLLGTPLVVDHIDPIRQFSNTRSRALGFGVRLAENSAFALADHTLYVYDEERRRVQRYARTTTKTDLGVAYDRFAKPDSEFIDRARDRLAAAGVDPDDRVAIYVGGLEPIYHIEELLGAIENLDGWTLVVLGTGSLVERVEQAACERENVIFPGTVDHEEVPGYLHAADVGISLVDDQHTLKVLEYAAAGLGVVQARGRAEARFSDYVEFCEPKPVPIANAIHRSTEHGASEEFQENVREFDYTQIAAKYANVLETVI